MIVNTVRKCLNQIKRQNIRNFAYVPIKRPTNRSQSYRKTLDVIDSDNVTLAEKLKTAIRANGPISIAQYMRSVLTNPDDGYYMKRDVIGRSGDFITSPEVGQIFGELVAVWIYIEWQKCGMPKPLQIIELGPGRGTLIQDIIRILSKLRVNGDISLHLVEASEFLCDVQANRLCVTHKKIADPNSPCYYNGQTISGIPVYWYKCIEDVPLGFSVVVANEFFDAMPIHGFNKVEGKWSEILIDVDESDENRFHYVLSPNETAFTKLFLNELNENDARDYVERSFETDRIIEILSNRLEADGGFGLVMDYGHTGQKTDTFRAFKNHKLHDPLVDPGTADLTADVDFKQIEEMCRKNNKLITFGPVTQQEFLLRMGGETRLNELIKENPMKEDVDALRSGWEMLTSPAKMGERFKFFAMFPKVLQEHLAKYPVHGFFS